jgi:hypothetical protein
MSWWLAKSIESKSSGHGSWRTNQIFQPQIYSQVDAGSALYTGALLSYWSLNQDYIHETIDHATAYVRGQVHTNGMKDFWSLLKRQIKGTYISVEPTTR